MGATDRPGGLVLPINEVGLLLVLAVIIDEVQGGRVD